MENNFKTGTHIQIVPLGHDEFKQYNIMTVDGSALHSMYFEEKEQALNYANRKGYIIEE